MARIAINGREHFYRLEGESGKPVLVLSHPVGADHGIWDQVVGGFTSQFQVLRHDLRGHGGSAAGAGDVTVDMLADDIAGLTQALGIERFAIAGVSLGALAALSLACRYPDKVEALVLANVCAKLPLTSEQWNSRIALVREHGMQGLVQGMVDRMFSSSYRKQNAPFMHTMINAFLSTPVVGYVGALAALRDADLRQALSAVQARTLVIGAAEDAAVPLVETRLLAEGIASARLKLLQGGHLTPVEAPEDFVRVVTGFLLH